MSARTSTRAAARRAPRKVTTKTKTKTTNASLLGSLITVNVGGGRSGGRRSGGGLFTRIKRAAVTTLARLKGVDYDRASARSLGRPPTGAGGGAGGFAAFRASRPDLFGPDDTDPDDIGGEGGEDTGRVGTTRAHCPDCGHAPDTGHAYDCPAGWHL